MKVKENLSFTYAFAQCEWASIWFFQHNHLYNPGPCSSPGSAQDESTIKYYTPFKC